MHGRQSEERVAPTSADAEPFEHFLHVADPTESANAPAEQLVQTVAPVSA